VHTNEICQECDAKAKNILNMTFTQAFKRFTSSVDTAINLANLRTGICETTLLIHEGTIYAHKSSRSLTGKRNYTIFLRHKEFFKAMLEMIRSSEQILNVTVPSLLFNLETKDNPTCNYPSSEMRSENIVAVKGIFHHSFCSPTLCDNVF
jgi:hypothetical protein